MAPSRLLTALGIFAIAVGLGAMAYAHLAVARRLHQTVEVVRRLLADGEEASVALEDAAIVADALRGPGDEVARRTAEIVGPSVVVSEALAETLEAFPGTAAGAPPPSPGGVRPEAGLVSSLSKLRRAVVGLARTAEELHAASRALERERRRHEVPSLRPAAAAAGARIREARAILAETNPARGMTLMADLIAGLYVVLGIALVILGRGTART